MTSLAPPTSLPRYDRPAPTYNPQQCLVITEDSHVVDHPALRDRSTLALKHLSLALHGSLDALKHEVQSIFNKSSVGLHVHLQGTESFIWSLHTLATASGLNDCEVTHCRTQPGNRTVFCVHCTTLQPIQTTAVHRCQACGVALEVRAHFSRRLGAYLGVCHDAVQPYGEVAP